MVTSNELNYLIKKANRLGIKGLYVRGIILPDSASLSVVDDTQFLVEPIDHMNLSASETAPWEG